MDPKDASGTERRYSVTIEGEGPTELTEAALVAAWQGSVPDLALYVRALKIGEERAVFEMPRIRVLRIQ